MLLSDPRDRYIERVAAGKSFVDVGGLWGVVNEKVTVAHQFGAASLAMLDITPEGNDFWSAFKQRLAQNKIPECRFISGDLLNIDGISFDVVHSSGVVYHLPNPLLYFEKLHSITNEFAIVSSAVAKPSLVNDLGSFSTEEATAIFVPALSERKRRVLAEYWALHAVSAMGITESYDYKDTSYGPWWWLPTERCLLRMAQVAGFKILGSQRFWNGNALAMLLAATEQKGSGGRP